MRRALLVLCAAALLAAPAASAGTSNDFAGRHAQVFQVVVVPGLGLAALQELAGAGAVGLLVPNAGPRTGRAAAFAGMVRGILYNTRLPWPKDSVLIHVRRSYALPRHGPAIVVGLPWGNHRANDRRYPIAVIGRGYRGLLMSSLTRVPGLVSMADVARTALQTPHALTWRRDGGAAASAARLESEIEVARTTTMPTSVLLLSLMVFIALLLPAGGPAALGSALLANLALGWLQQGNAVWRVALVGACAVAGAFLGPRRTTALGLALVGVLVAYAVTMVVQPWSLSFAPIGPELTSRFFGVSNLLEALLLVPGVVGAELLRQRFGRPAFALVAALTLATIAENRLGSDGGGAIVVGVTFALLGVWLAQLKRRYVIPALGAAAVVVLALANLDAASSSPDHLRGALQGGFRGLMHVAANRVPLAYDRMIQQWWLTIPLAFCVVVVAVARRNAAVVALAGGIGASLVVNDSAGPVTIGGLTGLLAVESGALHRALAVPVLRRLTPARPVLEQ